MTLAQLAESKKRRLLGEKRRIVRFLDKAPQGTLVYSKTVKQNKNYYKWYVSTGRSGKTRVYIPHRNRSLARQLAKKKLCLQRLQDINAELKAIDMYLKNHRDNTDLDTLLRTPAYGTLLFEEGFEMYGTMSENMRSIPKIPN